MHSWNRTDVEVWVPHRTVIWVPVVTEYFLRIISRMAKKSVTVLFCLSFEAFFFFVMGGSQNELGYRHVEITAIFCF